MASSQFVYYYADSQSEQNRQDYVINTEYCGDVTTHLLDSTRTSTDQIQISFVVGKCALWLTKNVTN